MPAQGRGREVKLKRPFATNTLKHRQKRGLLYFTVVRDPFAMEESRHTLCKICAVATLAPGDALGLLATGPSQYLENRDRSKNKVCM